MKPNILIQICIILAIFGQTVSLAGQTADITIHRIVYSERHANSVLSFRQLKLQKYNRTTQILKGDFEAYIDMDNTVSVSSGVYGAFMRFITMSACTSQISFTIYKKAGNQWKTTPFRIPETKVCDWVRDDTIFMGEMIKRSEMPPKGSCPAMPKVS
jgi:hypothetical protein